MRTQSASIGFVCYTLLLTDRKAWSLFAVRFSGYSAKPSLVCHTRKQPCQIKASSVCRAHFAQLANRDNIQRRPNQAKSKQWQRIGIAQYNRTHPHGSENGNAGGLCKASIYPYRSGIYDPPALAQCYHNRRIPLVWQRFKALSRCSSFALLPMSLYLRLNASRIA